MDFYENQSKDNPKKINKQKNLWKRENRNWIIFAILVYVCLILIMVFTLLFVNNKTMTQKQIWNVLYKRTHKKEKEDNANEDNHNPSNSPTILFDSFYIGNEPKLNGQGIYRLFNYENKPMGTIINAPASYGNLKVNNSLFWIDIVVKGLDYWALETNDPLIHIENKVYFNERGDAVSVPKFKIDNTLDNRKMTIKLDSFGLVLNSDMLNQNTLQIGDELIIPGENSDFAIFTNHMSSFNTFVSVRGGILTLKNNEVVSVLSENIVEAFDDSITFDIVFKGGKRALNYKSKLAKDFRFKARLKITKTKNEEKDVFYHVKQLEIPKSATNDPNVFQWNFPLTIDFIKISTKYDSSGNRITIPNLFVPYEKIEATLNPKTKFYELPDYNSTDKYAVLSHKYPYAMPDTVPLLMGYKNYALVKDVPEIYSSLTDKSKNIYVSGVDLVFSVMGFFIKESFEIEPLDSQIQTKIIYRMNGYNRKLYIRLITEDGKVNMHVLVFTKYFKIPTRLVAFKFHFKTRP